MNLSFFSPFLPYPSLIHLLLPSLSFTHPSSPPSFLILLSYFFSSFLPYPALILFLIPSLSCTHPSPPPSFLILLSYFFSSFLPCPKNHPSPPSFLILHSSFLPYPALILLLLSSSLSCTHPSPFSSCTHPSTPLSFLILHSSFSSSLLPYPALILLLTPFLSYTHPSSLILLLSFSHPSLILLLFLLRLDTFSSSTYILLIFKPLQI